MSKEIMQQPNLLFQVTTDVNNIINICFHITHFLYYFEFLLRAVIGPLSFWTIFIFLECIKFTSALACALLNTSVIIQLSIIWNFEWIAKFSDKVRRRKTDLNLYKRIFFIKRRQSSEHWGFLSSKFFQVPFWIIFW